MSAFNPTPKSGFFEDNTSVINIPLNLDDLVAGLIGHELIEYLQYMSMESADRDFYFKLLPVKSFTSLVV